MESIELLETHWGEIAEDDVLEPSRFPFTITHFEISGTLQSSEKLQSKSLQYKCHDIVTKKPFYCQIIAKTEFDCLARVLSRLAENRSDTSLFRRLFPEECVIVRRLLDVYGPIFYVFYPLYYATMYSHVSSEKGLLEAEVQRCFKMMVELLNGLHLRNISMRDMRLSQFAFADETKTSLRIAQLQHLDVVNADGTLNATCHCLLYRGPEMLHRDFRYYNGFWADIFGLGVCLYGAVYKEYLFREVDWQTYIYMIRNYTFNLPETAARGWVVPKTLKMLIQGLLRKNARERPDSTFVLHYPWVTKPVQHRLFRVVTIQKTVDGQQIKRDIRVRDKDAFVPDSNVSSLELVKAAVKEALCKKRFDYDDVDIVPNIDDWFD